MNPFNHRFSRQSPAFVLWVLGVLLTLSGLSPLHAREAILDFHSDITVQRDYSVVVSERIKVRAEHDEIIHGIYRDIKTVDRSFLLGPSYKKLNVFKIIRNGESIRGSVTSRFKAIGRKRVYLGTRQREIRKGIHTFRFVYRLSNVIKETGGKEQLYWDVTGTNWSFPIEQSSVTVRFPEQINTSALDARGFLGSRGSHNSQHVKISTVKPRHVTIKTTRPFNHSGGEGFTIRLKWSNDLASKFSMWSWLSTRYHSLVACLAMLIIVPFYGWSWWKHGRDRVKNQGSSRISLPPEELSPGATRYVDRMRFDNACISASLLSLASKGYISIHERTEEVGLGFVETDIIHFEQEKDAPIPDQTGEQGEESDLPPEEASLLNMMFPGNDRDYNPMEHSGRFRSARKEFKKQLEDNYHGRYFETNSIYSMIGINLALFFIVLMFFLDGMFGPPALFNIYGVLGMFVLGLTLSVTSFIWPRFFDQSVKGQQKGPGEMALLTVIGVFVGILYLGLVGLGEGLLYLSGGPLVALSMTLVFTCCGLFHTLLKAPTDKGRELQARIDQFRQRVREHLITRDFIEDQDPVRFMNRFLPYGVALGIDEQIHEKLEDLLPEVSGVTPGTAVPWFDHSHGNFSDVFQSLQTNFGQSFSGGAGGAAGGAAGGVGGGAGGAGGGGF